MKFRTCVQLFLRPKPLAAALAALALPALLGACAAAGRPDDPASRSVSAAVYGQGASGSFGSAGISGVTGNVYGAEPPFSRNW